MPCLGILRLVMAIARIRWVEPCRATAAARLPNSKATDFCFAVFGVCDADILDCGSHAAALRPWFIARPPLALAFAAALESFAVRSRPFWEKKSIRRCIFLGCWPAAASHDGTEAGISHASKQTASRAQAAHPFAAEGAEGRTRREKGTVAPSLPPAHQAGFSGSVTLPLIASGETCGRRRETHSDRIGRAQPTQEPCDAEGSAGRRPECTDRRAA